MRARDVFTGLVVFLMVLGLFSMASAKENNKAALSTGLEDQTGVSVTIYNVNLCLVKDQRKINLFRGTGD